MCTLPHFCICTYTIVSSSEKKSRTFQDQSHFPGLSRAWKIHKKNPGLSRRRGNPVHPLSVACVTCNKVTNPQLQMSTAGPYLSSPSSSSGGRYHNVITLFVYGRSLSSAWYSRAKPKSASFISPLQSKNYCRKSALSSVDSKYGKSVNKHYWDTHTEIIQYGTHNHDNVDLMQ